MTSSAIDLESLPCNPYERKIRRSDISLNVVQKRFQGEDTGRTLDRLETHMTLENRWGRNQTCRIALDGDTEITGLGLA